jgi:hypothetical protein
VIDLVFTSVNGRIHSAIDHLGVRSVEKPLGRELARIPLKGRDAELPLSYLIRKFAPAIASEAQQ